MNQPSDHEVFRTRAQALIDAFSMYPKTCRMEIQACCLAGLHHEPNQSAVFAEMRRVIRPHEGRVVIAEVHSDSDPARFLNGFVHRHNSHGHEGVFVDGEFVHGLAASGLKIVQDGQLAYPWIFDSRGALGDCLQRMFGIDLATPEEITLAVEDELGVDDLPDGRLGMRWSLRFFLANRD